MHDLTPPAWAGDPAARSAPQWQTVGLRAGALADLMQPLLPRLAWAHHGLCLALLVQLVAASLAHLSPQSAATRPGEATGLQRAESVPRSPPAPAG